MSSLFTAGEPAHGAGGARAEASLVHVLGLDYLHSTTTDGGDLYLTTHGIPLARQLAPENWLEPRWFRAHAERLDGSGSVYALPTKPVDCESIALVVKYSRIGERVPIDTKLIENVLTCEFNGPFEEFALLEDLRASGRGSSDQRIKTQLPLAIYVRPERSEPSQLQRFQWRVARKSALHPGLTIDIMRQYVMVFGWLEGIDAWEAHEMALLSEDDVQRLNQQQAAAMEAKGFRVLDMKPKHVIVQMSGPATLLHRDGDIDCGVVDYELLERTAEYHQEIRAARRKSYERLRGVSAARLDDGTSADASPASWPAGLHPATLFGVDYVHGRTESTGGMLWVVGRDPGLFDFFLPERWRTPLQRRFVETRDTFRTTSKDSIDFVWKVSRVGERPEMAAFGAAGFEAFAFGFNSPFEEVALAHRLRLHSFPAIAPLAVYRTASSPTLDEAHQDVSRYRTHAHLFACDGTPILELRGSYITIWDPWRWPGACVDDDPPSTVTINAAQAAERGLLSEGDVTALVDGFKRRLEALGLEVYRLRPTQILVGVTPGDEVLRDDGGALEACLCGFPHLSWPGR